VQWTLDLLFTRQIEQFLTVRDLEQIEQLAAIVHNSRAADEPAPVEAELLLRD